MEVTSHALRAGAAVSSTACRQCYTYYDSSVRESTVRRSVAFERAWFNARTAQRVDLQQRYQHELPVVDPEPQAELNARRNEAAR